MLDFLKKVFHKDNKDEKTATEVIEEKNSCKDIEIPIIEFESLEKISLQKDEDIPRVYRGTVQRSEPASFVVSIPEIQGAKPEPFSQNDSVVILVRRKEKTALFTTKLLNASGENLELEYPLEVQWSKTRERKHVRISTSLPAKVKLASDKSGSWDTIRLADISLSGLSFITDKPYKKGNRVNIKIMSMQFMLNLTADIVRAVKAEPGPDGNTPSACVIGVEFVELDEMEQQMLANFTYCLQRMEI